MDGGQDSWSEEWTEMLKLNLVAKIESDLVFAEFPHDQDVERSAVLRGVLFYSVNCEGNSPIGYM